jgi:hypothetical protein
MSYDQWKQTDTTADEQAEQDAKVAALAEQIRAGLSIEENIGEIEISASFDDSCCKAITKAFIDGTNPALALHAYALRWMDCESERLAKLQLQKDNR